MSFDTVMSLHATIPVPVVPDNFASSPALADSPPVTVGSSLTLLDRDHSILAFNERVLDWAYRPEVPLIERLRYLCIVSSNLDEFFEVRMAPHLAANTAGDRKGNYTVDSFARLSEAAHTLVGRQYALYNGELMPTFAKEGIHVISHGERNAAQRKWLSDYYEREVRPLLIPVGLDPAHPFPQVANKSLNFIVRLSGKDAFGRENPIAIVKVPRVLPRMIAMPARVSGGKKLFVALSSIVRAHLQGMFRGARWATSRSSASRAIPTWRSTRRTSRTCAPRCARGCSTATSGRPCGWRSRPAAPSRSRASCSRSSTCRRKRSTGCTGRSTWRGSRS